MNDSNAQQAAAAHWQLLQAAQWQKSFSFWGLLQMFLKS